MAKLEHKVVSKQEWAAARKDFLAKEKSSPDCAMS